MSAEQRSYTPEGIRVFANKLGVQTEGLEPWQVSQQLAEIAYQRRARALGMPSEMSRDPLEAMRFLLNRTDNIIHPGQIDIGSIRNYLEQTQIQELRLSDFPFFQGAGKRAKDLRRLADNPNHWKSREQFETEIKSTLDEVRSLLDQQDADGIKREDQILPQEKIDQIRKVLFLIYFVGARKFSKGLFDFPPDWCWPITWSDEPTFKDAKKSHEILQSWQTLDKQPTTYQAYSDLSDMYIRWLSAKTQYLTFTYPDLKFFRPYFQQKFPNWDKRARGLK